MHAASSLVLNAVKQLAEIPDRIHLLAPLITTALSHFKKDILGSRVVSLDLEETLIALSISAAMNPAAQAAVEKLAELRGCETHITHIPTPGDEAGLRKLGRQPDLRPELRHQGPVRGLIGRPPSAALPP